MLAGVVAVDGDLNVGIGSRVVDRDAREAFLGEATGGRGITCLLIWGSFPSPPFLVGLLLVPVPWVVNSIEVGMSQIIHRHGVRMRSCPADLTRIFFSDSGSPSVEVALGNDATERGATGGPCSTWQARS